MELQNEKILKLLDDKNVSITRLAKAIGVSQSGLNQSIKNGSLRASTLGKIATYLNVPVSEFYSGPVSKEESELEQKVNELETMMKVILNDLTRVKAQLIE